MRQSGAFRKKKAYFTQVSNNALRDNKLSLKAKGLYSLIQSYITIPDFILYKNTLKKQCLEGEKAFESAWKELKEKGYLIQYRLKDEVDGTFYYEYEMMDESIPTETEVVDKVEVEKVRGGKRGKYNNPNSNNTNLKNTNTTTRGRKKETFNNDSTEYLKANDIDALERKLLGWTQNNDVEG